MRPPEDHAPDTRTVTFPGTYGKDPAALALELPLGPGGRRAQSILARIHLSLSRYSIAFPQWMYVPSLVEFVGELERLSQGRADRASLAEDEVELTFAASPGRPDTVVVGGRLRGLYVPWDRANVLEGLGRPLNEGLRVAFGALIVERRALGPAVQELKDTLREIGATV